MNQSNVLRSALVMAALVVFLGAAHPLAAQATGTVRGTVTDAATHHPLSGVQINVVDGVRHAVTNASGEYTLELIPAGSFTLRAVFLGYKQANRAITVAAGQTTIADFALVGISIPLTSLDTVPSVSRDR
jgi:iron complex outermembrane receptor protein